MNTKEDFSICVITGMMSTYCDIIEKENERHCPDREGDGDARRGVLGAPVRDARIQEGEGITDT